MSFNNKPITAKIKRTTKGGMVQQPILNMGGPVKMKASSPAKVDPDPTKKKQQDFKNEMASQDKIKADNLAASKLAKAKKDKSSYNSMMDKYRSNVSSLNADVKNASKSLGKNDFAMRAAGRKVKEIAATENNLYNYDKKNKPGSTEGYTAKSYTRAKATGTYKSKVTKTDTAKNLKARSEGEAGWAADDKARKNKTGIYKPTSGKKVSYDTAYKNRDQKTYGKMDKATYIKEAKRQNASKKAGKGWDVKGKGKDTPPRKKVTASNIAPVGIKKVEISTKLDPKALKSQAAKVNAKTEPKKEVKKTRSQKLRSRGEKALADGNKKKALRIRRRYDKQVAKETKKKGQAASAIQPK